MDGGTDLKKRVTQVSMTGFPNYFGPQRFGHQASNIQNARDMLSGKVRVDDRNKRNIYLSAARSFLFNLVLSKRIKEDIWNEPIAGDIFWDVSESNVANTEDKVAAEITEKLKNGELQITGPLPGDMRISLVDESFNERECFEHKIITHDRTLFDGIANSRVHCQRRPLVAIPSDFTCIKNELGVELAFSLP